LRLRRTLAPSA